MFSVQLQKPAPILKRYVQFYTQRGLSLRDPLVVQSVSARPAPIFEFTFGDALKIRYKSSSVEETSPRAVLVGMLTRPHAELRLQGTIQSFVIVFHPAGLRELFSFPIGLLTDRDYDAHSVVGKPAAELEQRLGDCDSFASRVRAADAFLTLRVRDHASIDPVSIATGIILSKKGRVRIADLAACTGIGARQFEREFGSRYGMRPKLFSRIVRFQSALDSKARSFRKSWTDIAQEFGYYDQMHMIHDFREFTGETPKETLRLVEMLFRQQIEAIRIGAGTKDSVLVPRFVI